MSALAAVVDWFVEPAVQPEPAPAGPPPPGPAPRPVVAVAGLNRRAGTTTVARAIGAALAGNDPAGACVVTAGDGPAGVPLGLPAAGRLTRRIAPFVDGRVRACGRLCLVEGGDGVAVPAAARDLSPVVLDVFEPAEAAAAASLADHVVLVAGPDAEPSLASVVAESLSLVGPAPAIVLNRCARAGGRWGSQPHVAVPESRLAAQLAGAGREPRGPVGQAVAALVGSWGT